uniref:Protein tweety homolog n=1 Tax=Phallusia mammillata TaxID=59560 RepID=A0A6F9DWW7_9ASCI|nr:protein tweety homolog 1-A [Phallusia mammillata]
MDQYTPSAITQILHAIPHLSFKFNLLYDPEFTFDDVDYLESLAVVALMPVVLLLLTMIGFLFYYCCVRIKRVAPNKNNSSACYCSVCLMITFIMIALGGISVSSYGSIQCHDGVVQASSATMEINQSFSTITSQIQDVTDLLGELAEESNTLMASSMGEYNFTDLELAMQSLDIYLEDLPKQTEGADDRIEWTIELLAVVEKYRTIITFSLIGVQALVCLLGMAGVCFRSKCLLITTTFIGLVCLVASYLYIGSGLMVDVAVADLCMDPYNYIQTQAVSKLYMDNSTAQYYLTCSQEIGAPDPFTDLMKNFVAKVSEVQVMLESYLKQDNLLPVAETSLLQMLDIVNEVSRKVDELADELQCKSVNTSLQTFVNTICGSTLEGLFLLAVALLSTCFALTAVLCATPKTWKRYTKQRQNQDSDFDLDDVFLPTTNSRPVISRINNPMYVSNDGRGSRRISSNLSSTNLPAATNTLSFFRSEENMTLLEQPPPYSPPHPSSRYNDE